MTSRYSFILFAFVNEVNKSALFTPTSFKFILKYFYFSFLSRSVRTIWLKMYWKPIVLPIFIKESIIRICVNRKINYTLKSRENEYKNLTYKGGGDEEIVILALRQYFSSEYFISNKIS